MANITKPNYRAAAVATAQPLPSWALHLSSTIRQQWSPDRESGIPMRCIEQKEEAIRESPRKINDTMEKKWIEGNEEGCVCNSDVPWVMNLPNNLNQQPQYTNFSPGQSSRRRALLHRCRKRATSGKCRPPWLKLRVIVFLNAPWERMAQICITRKGNAREL